MHVTHTKIFFYAVIIFFTHTLTYTAEHDPGESSSAKRPALPSLYERLLNPALTPPPTQAEVDSTPTILLRVIYEALEKIKEPPYKSPTDNWVNFIRYSWAKKLDPPTRHNLVRRFLEYPELYFFPRMVNDAYWENKGEKVSIEDHLNITVHIERLPNPAPRIISIRSIYIPRSEAEKPVIAIQEIEGRKPPRDDVFHNVHL